MAAAELRREHSTGRRHKSVWPAVLWAYLALWAITLAGATLSAVLAAGAVRAAMGLTFEASRNPTPSLGRVLALWAHNLPICAWPLLLGSLGLAQRSPWRRAADILVSACALANALPVAAALGGYGGELVPYVPQLPLEWAALAVGYGSWLIERGSGLARGQRLALLGAAVLLLLAAAALETCAVPHR